MKSLAELIVDQVYGEEYASICRTLSQHEALSIHDLKQFSEVPYNRLREILMVLYDSNFLDYKDSLFALSLDNIILSLNYPIYYELVREQEGALAATILLQFFELSSCSLNDILQHF